MTRDDDTPTAPLPPDAPADAAEKAHARGFGDLIDKVLAGRAPAAVPAEDRALLEVATVIGAASRPVELGAAKTRSIVESALAMAIERRGGGSRLADPALPVTGAEVASLADARRRRLAPWVVAGVTSVIAAAAVVLLLARPATPPPSPAPTTAATLPPHLRSRPADPLIGAIAPAASLDAASGAAVSRIDTIYADRLAGFRERTLDGAPRSRAVRRRSGQAGGQP